MLVRVEQPQPPQAACKCGGASHVTRRVGATKKYNFDYWVVAALRGKNT